MKYEFEGRSTKKRKFLEYLMPSLLRQLNLTGSKKTVTIAMRKDIDQHGLALNLGDLGIFVFINSKLDLVSLGVTLAHEMVHVAQMARGTLKDGPRGSVLWSGRKFGKNTPYMSRPWELQAYAKQEILVRRALEEI